MQKNKTLSCLQDNVFLIVFQWLQILRLLCTLFISTGLIVLYVAKGCIRLRLLRGLFPKLVVLYVAKKPDGF